VPTWLKNFSIVARKRNLRGPGLPKHKTAVSAKIKNGVHGKQRAMWNSRKHARAENSPSPAFVLMIIVTHTTGIKVGPWDGGSRSTGFHKVAGPIFRIDAGRNLQERS
jgi:hypothetical protein